MDWRKLVARDLSAMAVNADVTVIYDGVKIVYETDPETGIVIGIDDIIEEEA